MAVCCLVGHFFWDSDKCGHWRFQVKCVVKCMSRCAELSLRSGDELGGGAKGSTRDRKVGCFTRIYFIPGEWWQSEEKPQQVVCPRAEDESGDLEEWRERGWSAVSLSASLDGVSQVLFVCFSFFEWRNVMFLYWLLTNQIIYSSWSSKIIIANLIWLHQ